MKIFSLQNPITKVILVMLVTLASTGMLSGLLNIYLNFSVVTLTEIQFRVQLKGYLNTLIAMGNLLFLLMLLVFTFVAPIFTFWYFVKIILKKKLTQGEQPIPFAS